MLNGARGTLGQDWYTYKALNFQENHAEFQGAGDEASALTELSAVAQGFAASQLLGGGAGWWQGEGFEQRPSIQTDGASPSSSASRSDEAWGGSNRTSMPTRGLLPSFAMSCRMGRR